MSVPHHDGPRGGLAAGEPGRPEVVVVREAVVKPTAANMSRAAGVFMVRVESKLMVHGGEQPPDHIWGGAGRRIVAREGSGARARCQKIDTPRPKMWGARMTGCGPV